MFAGYLFLRFTDGRENRQTNTSQTLMNLQYIVLVRAVGARAVRRMCD